MMFYIFNTSYELIATTDKINQAIHAEEINNENALLLTVTEPDYMDLLVEHNLVGFFDDDEEFQLFRIQKVEDEDNGIVTRDLYAVHIAYDLAYEYVEDIRPTGTAEAILTELLTDSDWEVGTVADFGSSHVQFYYESIKSGIAKIIEAMGGEVRYRLALSGSEITHKYVDILESRGSVTGKRFTYTKDIINIHRTIDMNNVITRCYGFGKGEAIENETGETSYGRRINFNDIVWTISGGDPVDKPEGQKYVEDAGAIALYGTRTGKAIFDDETDAETVLELTWDYLQINKDPVVSYELDVMLLEKLSGYSHEAVRLGDIVVVIDKAITPEIKISARVLRFEKDLLALDQSKVVLGNFVETLTGQVRDNVKVIDRYRDREGAYDDGSMRAIDGLDESGYVGLPIHSEKIVGDDALDGLNLTNTYLGYYNLAQDAWRAFIDRLGNFLFQKDADNYFKFDGTDFEFKGPVIVTGGDATKTFTSEPTTPYKVGDLWTGLSAGDLKVCTTARTTGAYVAGDWVLASEYTKGADWSSNLSNIPDTLGEPFDAGDNGLHLTGTYMGYYSHPNWTAFIKNDGTFLFQKDANNYFVFDGTNFTFRGPLVGEDIAAESITVDKLAVLAKNKVNNYSVTNTTTGWARMDGVAMQLNTGTSKIAPVHVFTSDGNSSCWSDKFDIDPTKSYKITLSMSGSAATGGTRYFGIYVYDKDNVKLSVTPFTVSTRAFGTDTDDPFFWSLAGATGWVNIEGYVMSSNSVEADFPQGLNATKHFKLPANAAKMLVRYLNFGNSGTPSTVYVYSPSVTEVGSSAIVAEQVTAGKLQSVDGKTYFDLTNSEICQSATIGGKTAVFKANPTVGLELVWDSKKVFGVDTAGRIFTNAMSNVDSSGYYMTYGYGGSPGLECFHPEGGTGSPIKFLGISPDISDGIQLYDVNTKLRLIIAAVGYTGFRDQNGYSRFVIDSDGATYFRDGNNKIRFHMQASGINDILATNGEAVFASNADGSVVELTCATDNTQKLGVDESGPYFQKNGTKTYMGGIISKSTNIAVSSSKTVTVSAAGTFQVFTRRRTSTGANGVYVASTYLLSANRWLITTLAAGTDATVSATGNDTFSIANGSADYTMDVTVVSLNGAEFAFS